MAKFRHLVEILKALLEINDESFSCDSKACHWPSEGKGIRSKPQFGKLDPLPNLRYRLELSPIDRWKRTPLEDAEFFGHIEFCEILKKAIAGTRTI